MFILQCVVVIVIVNCLSASAQFFQMAKLRRLAKPSGMKLKEKIQEKLMMQKRRTMETICYDLVGCFDVPHRRSPLQKSPENPALLNTRFYLFTRKTNFSDPEIIYYNDGGKSLNESRFNYSLPLKLIIHGYMGQWSDSGYVIGADAYLKIYDCNVILMDWSIGARGNQYATAAANTEVVGRQLGLLLLEIIKKGFKPDNMHLLGFSLGAHVAGSASEVLKKQGHLIGRITGLDAASPLFRTEHLKEKNKKLDREDAKLVDVIHTDASPSLTDGFGLWEPIGHVDFFSNGGQEQPGCTDTKQSVVVSHFDKTLTLDAACSHIRAWKLFVETLLNKAKNVPNHCQFTAFKCPGGVKSFEQGYCFPQLQQSTNSSLLNNNYHVGNFGEDVKGQGIMFFSTKATAPFCGICKYNIEQSVSKKSCKVLVQSRHVLGTQMQASVLISPKSGPIKGYLFINLVYPAHTIQFQIYCESKDSMLLTGNSMNGFGVADYNSLSDEVYHLKATLQFFDEDEADDKQYSPMIFIDRISVRDMYGNSWHFCQKDTIVQNPSKSNYKQNITLSKIMCF